MAFWSRSTTPAKGESNPALVKPGAELSCSFCRKTQREVKKLVAGPDVYICDACVGLANDVIYAEPPPPPPPIPPIGELVSAFEADVLGQAVACRTIAAALVRHLRGIRGEAPHGPVRVLLVGPRGCGKTTLLRALCRISGLPAYHADASRMSETGYIGENVENIVGALLERSDDVEAARRGVLALDGLHHLVRQSPYPNARDIAGREAQRDLVRLLDGMEIAAVRNARRHPQAPNEPVVCDRLFVAAAASFEVTATDEVGLREELAAKGLVDETLARFDVIVPMRRLSAADLRGVLARLVEPGRAFVEAAGGSVEIADGDALLAERAAGSADGAFALLPPLSRLRERALLEGPRRWVLDRALGEELLRARG